MNPQNIRIILTESSDIILNDIAKKYALQDDKTTMDMPKSIKMLSIAKSFSRGDVSQIDLTSLLQKELSVSQQIAAQISNDIIKDLIPTFKKISEEDLTKLSEEQKDALIYGPTKKVEPQEPVMPKIKAPIEVEKIIHPSPNPVPTKKYPPSVKAKPDVKKSRKPDSYREPIE